MLSGACWRVSHPARWCPDGAVQELFFQERFKCMQGRQGQADKNTDAFARTFGTAMPQSIPESSAWWLGRKDLGTVRVFASVYACRRASSMRMPGQGGACSRKNC